MASYGSKESGRAGRAGRPAKAHKPVTSHPLFPPIVGLWFAALFCLGSLAIRPALMESLVLKLHIDVILPAAAPPLGAKARILIALTLAILGGVLGTGIGRWIARPRPVVVERRRGHAEPLADASGATRRRGLAIADEDPSAAYGREHAPLPGGAPQILDVTEFDFDREDRAAAAAASAAGADLGALDLSGFLSGEAPQPEVRPLELLDSEELAARTAHAAAEREADHAGQRPFDRGVEPVAISTPVPAAFASPDPLRPFAPPPASGQDSDDAAAPAPRAPEPVAVAPAVSEVLAVPEVFAPAAILQRLPAHAEGADVIDADVIDADVIDADRAEDQGRDDEAQYAEGMVATLAERSLPAAPEPEIPADEPAVADTAPVVPPPAIAAPVAELPLAPAVPAQAADDTLLDDLSSLELIERLARSLKRRRQAEGAVVPAPALDAPEAIAPPPPEAAPCLPDPVAAAMAEPPAEPVPFKLAAPHAVLVQDEQGRPVPPPLAMPMALRPIRFDVADDDVEELDAYIPPRRIAMPEAEAMPEAAPEEPELASFAEPVAVGEEAEVEAESEIDAEAETLDPGEDEAELTEGYSSLLELSRPATPRPGFIRIEEPQSALAAAEPVVIFPGQSVRTFAAPVAPAMADTGADSAVAAPRRFDAPPSAMAPGMTFASPSQSPEDREETERALRTALATLQRMSGAA